MFLKGLDVLVDDLQIFIVKGLAVYAKFVQLHDRLFLMLFPVAADIKQAHCFKKRIELFPDIEVHGASNLISEIWCSSNLLYVYGSAFSSGFPNA
ncbi:hypothetical protein D3C85_1659680 [compost metagenome]